MNNVLITTYWSYREPLIQTYTLPYVRIIRKNLAADAKIYLFTLEQKQLAMTHKEWQEESEKLEKEGIIILRAKYHTFGIKMILNFLFVFLKLWYICVFKKISVIHAWCTPGGVVGYLLSVFARKPLIIDSYEPHAESMVENGEWTSQSKAFKILFWFEKRMSRKTDTVIALTEGMRNYAQTKYQATFKNYFVKPALVDFEKFNMQPPKDQKLMQKFGLEDKLVCIYAGKLGGIYLDTEVFDMFKVMYDYWGEKIKILLLTSREKEWVKNQINMRNIPASSIHILYIDFSEIHKYYRLADFAINPVKPVPSKRYCTSIKDGEYWAMGLPVIIPANISDDSEIIEKNNIGFVLDKLNENYYKKAIEKMDMMLSGNSDELKQKIFSIANQYRNFKVAEKIYKEIYNQN